MEKFILLIIGIIIFGIQHFLSLKPSKWLGFVVPSLTVIGAVILYATRHCALTMENTLPFVLLIIFEVIIWILDKGNRNKNKVDTKNSKSDDSKTA